MFRATVRASKEMSPAIAIMQMNNLPLLMGSSKIRCGSLI
jgi:hypothetical protein